MNKILPLFIVILISFSCSKKVIQLYKPHAQDFKYNGRTEIQSDSTVNFITSASGVEIHFTGDTCSVLLKNATNSTPYNYMSIEIDGKYIGRIKVINDSLKAYPIALDKNIEEHKLLLVKSTEASNGAINFGGIYCNEIKSFMPTTVAKIEFIGNSITCAMGADTSEIPCHKNQWYDQHNAYFSYGRLVANNLNAEFLLSSVSGIGIYRTWNMEGLSMPMVYQNTYLNLDSAKRWDFKRFTPDIVSIALGTNDLSDGDGINPRKPFEPDTYINGYINFLNTIYSKYPATKVALLTSSMVSGAKDSVFNDCLKKIKSHFNDKKIEIFSFAGIVPHGCDYHPNIEEHKRMADTLTPFFKKLIESK